MSVKPKLIAFYLVFASLGVGCGLEWRAAEQDRHHAAAAAARLNTFRMALEQYGTENNGSYPLPQTLPAALVVRDLPANPWSKAGAPMKLHRGPWPKALNGVGPVARGEATLSAVGTDLGAGHYPGDGPDDHLTYGTLFYAYEPNHQIYVVYVVGKRGDRAVVLGGTSNGSC